jgi:hypothetical protein
MPNYHNSKVYKIWSPSTEMVYIGSTTQGLSMRLSSHVRDYKLYLNGEKNFISSFEIIKYGDYKIELIEKIDCECREELCRAEGKFIRNTENCINMCIAGRTHQEWRQENKEKITEYRRQYYQDNKEKINEIHRQYYQENKEKFAENQRQYQQENKEKIAEIRRQYQQENKEKFAEYNRQYYQDNKEKISKKNKEKITCECGSTITKSSILKHRRSKKHQKFINQLN